MATPPQSQFKPDYDYLKYWRAMRYYFKTKYNISTEDLDTLLFLYTERYFSKSKFREFAQILSWNKERFQRLLDEGWIDCIRKNTYYEVGLYKISGKGRVMITSLYNKLNGDELPTSPAANPMFKKRTTYTNKVYRREIKRMNEETRSKKFSDPT